jgi:hypothetical protein
MVSLQMILSKKSKKNKKLIGKSLLYISDIRQGDSNYKQFEKIVWADMVKQQRWVILLDSEMAMLKFRLPYVFDKESRVDLKYDMTDISKYITAKNNKIDGKDKAQYLDGELFIQINPNVFSTETRLITRRTDGKYILKSYDTLKYESQCYYYNMEDRIKDYDYKDSKILKSHLAGFDDSYDRVAEYYIWCKYQKYYLKKEYDLNEIIEFLYETHSYLYKLTKRNIITCKFDTIIKDYIPKYHNQHIPPETINNFKKEQNNIIDNLNKQK